ncbi:helix-turn-helix transcriptional regulator [Meridianimarinicoccus sp. RP-17]|uniref:helix-turn-helix transcriptional regulator n=1 Tax=Meridianimarinicoccus zhengii TaxID=2056810 RepID=UPI000DACB162|nr:AlpA family phage regulatory protein [Phycocomes zhengii]
MLSANFITAHTVAQLIGLPSGAAFLRNRDRLEEDLSFPQPMPVARRPMVWRRDEVQAWAARQGKPRDIDPATLGGNVVALRARAS